MDVVRQKTTLAVSVRLPDDELVLRRTWTQAPLEEGLCTDCKVQFMAISCFDDGKNYYCPRCSRLLTFEVTKLEDKSAEEKVSGSENGESCKTNDTNGSRRDLHEDQGDDADTDSQSDCKSIGEQMSYQRDTTSEDSVVAKSAETGRKNKEKSVSFENESDFHKNAGLAKSAPHEKEQRAKLTLRRGKTEIGTQNRKPDKQVEKLDRSKSMVVTGSKFTQRKLSSKSVSSPFLKAELSEIKMKFQKEFVCKRHKGCVNSITPTTNEKAWMVIQNSVVALYNKNGSLLQNVTRLRKNVTDACMDENGNLYLACFKDKCVMRASKSGQVSKFADTLGMFPAEVALTPRNEIVIVGVGRNDSVTYDVNKEYGVLIFAMDGNLIAKIQDKDKPFQYPIYVDASIHGDLAVGDYITKEIVILDFGGTELFRFNGSDIFAHTFVPKGLCFDRKGNVIVANWDGALCILERNNDFAARGLLFPDGFEPLSLAVDEKNDLWIGGRSGAIIRIYSFE